MVSVLVILDGASEMPGGATSLQRAETPTLDLLAAQGAMTVRRTIPVGLPVGSEVGIPCLLGLEVAEAPSRGLIEAAAAGIAVPEGVEVVRCDAPRDRDQADALREGVAIGLVHVRGHRFVAIGDVPALPVGWRRWSTGSIPDWRLPEGTVVIGGPGSAVGVATLARADWRVPEGATADVDTDLAGKARVAVAEMQRARRVVVHVAAPDEASHQRDPELKVELLERIDSQLLAPLAEAVGSAQGLLEIAADHGTDPHTGAHLADPVPFLRWGHGVDAAGPDRFVERSAVAA